MSNASAPTFSLVLPCYNEEANVEATMRDVVAFFDKHRIQGEIIAVNDGSRDRTGAMLEHLAGQDQRIKVINHAKNQGYGLAIRTGCDAVTTDWMGYMDSDGQFHAEDLNTLIPHLTEYPFVTGRRCKRADSFIRNTFGKVLGAMNFLMLGLWVRDVNCGMKVYRTSIWQAIRPTHGVEKLFNTEIFLRLKEQKIPWLMLDVPHYPRTAGNPTGATIAVIKRMFLELRDLRRAKKERIAMLAEARA